MKRTIPFLILALAAIGLADSVYLTLVHFGVGSFEPQVVAGACQFKNGSCSSVAQSSAATTIGIPNAIFGALYFAFLAGVALVRVVTGSWLFPHLLLGVMLAALAFSGYLVYMLFFELGIPCGFCLTAHAANVLAFLMFLISWRRTPPRAQFRSAPRLRPAA